MDGLEHVESDQKTNDSKMKKGGPSERIESAWQKLTGARLAQDPPSRLRELTKHPRSFCESVSLDEITVEKSSALRS